MKKNVKLFATMLALVLALGVLSACGGTPAVTPAPATPPPAPAVETPAADALDRGEYKIPDEYTKIKIFDGSYGFGDAEIQAAMTEDETGFYMQFICFDEDQILQGTVENGICMVTLDLSGFLAGDAQLIYDDAIASDKPWQPLTGAGVAAPAAGAAAPVAEGIPRGDYKIPENYTKIKVFDGSYGFGDAEIQAAMTEDETGFYMQFVCFDEDQILEGTVANGICVVSLDLTGFMASDAQLIYDDAIASDKPWIPLVD